MNMKVKYHRVILKLSGEALTDDSARTILSKEKLESIVNLIEMLHLEGVKIGVVIGAGNIFRGRVANEIGLEKVDGDYMGMVGTVINCKALYSLLTYRHIDAELYSTIQVDKVTLPYDPLLAKKDYDEGKVVIFAGGVGEPGFTTDTCASLRAIDVKAELIMAGKNGVDGVYTSDPRKNKDAKFISRLTYRDVIEKKLSVIDASAAKDLIGKGIATRIFSMDNPSNFVKIIEGEDIGTLIEED
jgi:uridylate kinase